MIKLTPRQQEILDFIRNTLEILGSPPTRAEIASAFGFAPAAGGVARVSRTCRPT